ncbi:MAG: sigma-70 family RNA polymerase sigma factor [Planctomycetota bacterium]
MEANQDVTTEELFSAFRDYGDADALTAVFDRLAPKLLEVALRLCSDAPQAEDVVQETFLLAIEKARRWDASRPLLPWLQGILFREARRARRQPLRGRGDADAGGAGDAAEPLHAGELRESVERALGRVSDTYRELLRRSLFDGLTPMELAGELNRDPGTIRVQLHRGLDQLRRALPAGFAFGLLGAAMPRGLAAVREVVRERASGLPAAPLAGVGGTTLALVPMSKKVAVVAVALAAAVLGVTQLWPAAVPARRMNAARPSEQTVATLDGVAAPAAPAEPAGPARSTGRVRVDPLSESDAVSTEQHEVNRVTLRGRLVFANGDAPEEPKVFFVEPTRTASASAGSMPRAEVSADGRFELAVDTPGLGRLAAIAEGTDTLLIDPWAEPGAHEQGVVDLGELVLVEGARLTGWAYRDGQLMHDGEIYAYLNSPRLDNNLLGPAPLEFAGDGTIAPWITRAEVQPDGRFELSGLKTRATYRLVAVPSELSRLRPRVVDPIGMPVQAPANGVVLDWGLRIVRFRVTSNGRAVPRAGVRPWVRPGDPRRDESKIGWIEFQPPLYGDVAGRVDALLPQDGAQHLQVSAPGFVSRVVEFDAATLARGEEYSVELEPTASQGVLCLSFVGAEPEDLKGLAVRLEVITRRGFETVGTVPVGNMQARFERVPTPASFFQFRFVAAQASDARASFVRLDDVDSFLLTPDLQAGEERVRQTRVDVGGRIDLNLLGIDPSGGEPRFQVAKSGEDDGDASESMRADELSRAILQPGGYVVRQVGSAYANGEVAVDVRERSATKVDFRLYR